MSSEVSFVQNSAVASERTPIDKLSQLTFLMIGCQRCGTTWTDRALREHPQIYLPPEKKTHFFDRHYDQGIDAYFQNYTAIGPEHIAIGEVASGYCQVGVLPRVAEHLPHIRVFMSMRHPVDRAYSYYLARSIVESHRDWTFEDALENDPNIIDRGHYIDQIEIIRAHYPPERVLLLFYDDLVADERAFLSQIHRFLGVTEMPDNRRVGERSHSARAVGYRKWINRLGLKRAVATVSGTRLGGLARRLLKKSGQTNYKQQMTLETRASLIKHYTPYNARLATFTGRNLDHWNQ